MKKFNVKDRVFLDEAIHAFLRESKKFEEEQELLGNRPIITYKYWKMMAEEVMYKLEFLIGVGYTLQLLSLQYNGLDNRPQKVPVSLN